MSSKSSRGPVKVTKTPSPRALVDIQAEYGQLSAQAAQVQYQTFVLKQELENINNRLMQLNREGAARNKLDQDAAAKETPKETTDVQS